MVNQNKLIEASVYVLHAGDEILAYVGSTSKNAPNRLWEHKYRARTGHAAPVYQWMREVGIENVRAVVLAFEPDAEIRQALEAVTIAQLLAEGHPLVNAKSRDGVVDSMSETTKALIGNRNRGRETWIKGKTGEAAGWTQERREKQSRDQKARRARAAA